MSAFSIGNPQCVVLGPLPGRRAVRTRLGRRSSATPRSRTAPTSSSPRSRRRTACASGSGSAASGRPSRPAPARAPRLWRPSPTAGGAASVEVVAPGGTQRVEWAEDGPVPDRLGRAALGRDLACRPLTRRSRPSRATRRPRSGSTAGAAPSAFGSRRRVLLLLLACRCRCPSPATAWPRSWRSSSCCWVTEALPMAVTAMLGPVLAVIFGVADARGALAPFADPIIFLFIGSFILAEAMFVHGVDRRIAFTALSSRFVGASATRVLVVYAAVATVLSMWISNTATTAMMFPIGLSIVNHLMRVAPKGESARQSVRQFALGLMLDHVVRRVGRRHGDAGGHAAEPDRHRHARAHRARPDHVLPLDGPGRADRRAAVRVPGRAVLVHLHARSARRGGQQRTGARRAPAARAGCRPPSATCSSRSA